ncbi:MAG: hypothetical protein ACI80I_000295 [Akkermansiaceae bacterium]|jgi:hypothetical protein
MYCSFTGTYVLRDVAGATYFSRPDKMFVVVPWDRLFIGEVRVKRACANVCGITNSAAVNLCWLMRCCGAVSPADKGRFRTTATPSPHDTPRAWFTVGCDGLRGVARIALPFAGQDHRLLAEAVAHLVYRGHQGAGFRAHLLEQSGFVGRGRYTIVSELPLENARRSKSGWDV